MGTEWFLRGLEKKKEKGYSSRARLALCVAAEELSRQMVRRCSRFLSDYPVQLLFFLSARSQELVRGLHDERLSNDKYLG